MKRAKPIQRKTRLKSVNRERAAKRKARDFGEYAEWIRLRPCVIRDGGVHWSHWSAKHQASVCEAAHVRGRGAGGHADANLISLCAGHHRLHSQSLHNQGPQSFERIWGVDLGAIAADLWGRYQREISGDAA